jgi:hypothetical protein
MIVFFCIAAIFETRARDDQMDSESDSPQQGHEHRLCRLDQRWKSFVTVSHNSSDYYNNMALTYKVEHIIYIWFR